MTPEIRTTGPPVVPLGTLVIRGDAISKTNLTFELLLEGPSHSYFRICIESG
jgi:hypothetical protein